MYTWKRECIPTMNEQISVHTLDSFVPRHNKLSSECLEMRLTHRITTQSKETIYWANIRIDNYNLFSYLGAEIRLTMGQDRCWYTENYTKCIQSHTENEEIFYNSYTQLAMSNWLFTNMQQGVFNALNPQNTSQRLATTYKPVLEDFRSTRSRPDDSSPAPNCYDKQGVTRRYNVVFT